MYLRHSSFSNPSVASPTSQFILQPFFRFCYVTSSSLNSPGEPPLAKCSLLFTLVDGLVLFLDQMLLCKCEVYVMAWLESQLYFFSVMYIIINIKFTCYCYELRNKIFLEWKGTGPILLQKILYFVHYVLSLGASTGHFDRQTLFMCLYFVNSLHLISLFEIFLSFFTSTHNFRHFKKIIRVGFMTSSTYLY